MTPVIISTMRTRALSRRLNAGMGSCALMYASGVRPPSRCWYTLANSSLMPSRNSLPSRQRLEVKLVSCRQKSTKSTTPACPQGRMLASVSATTASPYVRMRRSRSAGNSILSCSAIFSGEAS